MSPQVKMLTLIYEAASRAKSETVPLWIFSSAMEKYNYKEYMLVGNCGLMVQLLLLLRHATIAHHHMLRFQQENQSRDRFYLYILIMQLIILIELF